VPIVLVILFFLFVFQQFGTKIVGGIFGPVMLIWFGMIGVLGALQIVKLARCVGSFKSTIMPTIFLLIIRAGFGYWAQFFFVPPGAKHFTQTWVTAANTISD
jgi:K+ transporter